MDRIAVAESVLSRQLGWIAAADARLALALPLNTAMLGTLAALFPKPGQATLGYGLAASMAAILLGGSIVCCAWAALPRRHGRRDTLIYFEDIAQLSSDLHLKRMQQITDADYLVDLCLQCHVNARIAFSKFQGVRCALLLLMAGTVPWLLSIKAVLAGV
jgi:hypothetical protein